MNTIFGSAGDDFGSSLELSNDWMVGTSKSQPLMPADDYFGGITDRIFGLGTDVLGSYLDLKTNELLIGEQTKLALAQQRQAALLGTVEQPFQTNAGTLQPWQIAALSNQPTAGGSDNNNLLLILAAIAVVALVA